MSEANGNSLQRLVRCDLCGERVDAEDVQHLPLYVFGSEGVEACLWCRKAMTDFARSLREATGRAYNRGYKSAVAKSERVQAANAPREAGAVAPSLHADVGARKENAQT